LQLAVQRRRFGLSISDDICSNDTHILELSVSRYLIVKLIPSLRIRSSLSARPPVSPFVPSVTQEPNLEPSFSEFPPLWLLSTRLVCRNTEEQSLMRPRDTRSTAGSAVNSAQDPEPISRLVEDRLSSQLRWPLQGKNVLL